MRKTPARRQALPRGGIAVQLRADYVGEVVVAAPVGIDGPEHSADHLGIAGRLTELVGDARGGFAGDEVVHRLADDSRRRVAGEKADGDFIGGGRPRKKPGGGPRRGSAPGRWWGRGRGGRRARGGESTAAGPSRG